MQIYPLKRAQLQNGQVINADDINTEFDQLISVVNRLLIVNKGLQLEVNQLKNQFEVFSSD